MTARRRDIVSRSASRLLGADHEAWVFDHGREAVRLGILADYLVHNEPHGKFIGGKWEMVAPGVADFTGVLCNGHGSTIAIEAKARRDRVYKSDVTTAQRRHLDAVARAGGVALLAARIVEVVEDARELPASRDGKTVAVRVCSEFQTDYVVPWAEVPWEVKKSAESVGVAELAPWLVAPEEKCFLERHCPVRGAPRPSRRHPRE